MSRGQARSKVGWWIAGTIAAIAAGYWFFWREGDSTGMKPLPNGRVTPALFQPPPKRTAPVRQQPHGDAVTAPPSGLRIVNPSPAAQQPPTPRHEP